MKIRITQGPPPGAGKARLKIREKAVYHCTDCNNKYYTFYFFCPQCLSEVRCSTPQRSALRITSCDTDIPSAVDLMLKLSENREFDFEKAFQSLPWICMVDSDPNILQHWKECLDAQRISSEIMDSGVPAKRGRKKPHAPLYAAEALYPNFLESKTARLVRKTARSIPLASVRLKWAETVLQALHILETLYKNNTGRILFYDIILQIEEKLCNFSELHEHGRWSESDFLKRLDKLSASFEQMQSEIQEVRAQVEDRL